MKESRVSLIIITSILIGVGIVMVYSSSAIYAAKLYKDSAFFLKRYLIYLAVGTIGGLLVMSIDYRDLRKYAKPLMVLTLVLLSMVLVPVFAKEAGGARRWLRVWRFTFQPVELAKIAIVVYIADFLSRKQSAIKTFFYGFLPPTLVIAAVFSLILLQPDLGSALLLATVVFLLFFVSGMRRSYLIITAFSSIPAVAILILSRPYRISRIATFLNPWVDSQGAGYQLIQSLIAIGSGGLFGVGLGLSRQKLFYLPAAHTDFIFSIIGEELGLLGTLSVVLLFILFIWQGMKITLKAQDLFGHLLSLGIVSMLAIQAIVNLGVSTGVLPTKGLPLPFISYGGSSLIFNMLGVALVLNVAREKRRNTGPVRNSSGKSILWNNPDDTSECKNYL